MSIFTTTKAVGDQMPERHIGDIFDHLEGEIEELLEEIEKDHFKEEPGEDGIKGEVVDCIGCLIDLLQVRYPDMTEEEFNNIYQQKLDKWKEKYS